MAVQFSCFVMALGFNIADVGVCCAEEIGSYDSLSILQSSPPPTAPTGPIWHPAFEERLSTLPPTAPTGPVWRPAFEEVLSTPPTGPTGPIWLPLQPDGILTGYRGNLGNRSHLNSIGRDTLPGLRLDSMSSENQ